MLKTLLAAVFLSAAATNASAYSHSFVNRLKHPVHFWVNYAACSNDSWTVQPGQTITWRSGLCCISSANAVDPRKPEERSGTQKNEFFGSEDGYYAVSWMAGEFPGAICRNTNWSLEGTVVRGG